MQRVEEFLFAVWKRSLNSFAIALVVVALFNTYILCRYPGYRAIREKIAEEEDKRLEAKISAQARKQAMKTLRGG